MPDAALRPCAHPTCPELVKRPGRFCPAHAHLDVRVDNRLPARARGYDTTWEKIRLQILAREPLCRRCLPTGRAEPAVVVHHKDRNPRNNDPENLEPLCADCHRQEHAGESLPWRRGQAQFEVPVELVCGCAGSGKNYYVERHRQDGDLIVDVDALYQACSGLPLHEMPDQLLPFVCEARDAIIERLLRPSRVRKAWIVTTDPEKREEFRRRGARVVMIDTPEEVCQRRLEARPATWSQDAEQLIWRWKQRYVPDGRDTLIRGGGGSKSL